MTTVANDNALSQEPQALAHADLVKPVGLEDYDGTEFRLPRLSVVQTAQQMSEWDAKAGQFHNSVTGENVNELDAVVLAVKQNRWWGPSFEESTKMRGAGREVQAFCKSSNGKSPDADSPQRQADFCKICPKSKGVKNPDGSYEPPACTEIRKVLLALADGTVALLPARKKAVREVDNFAQPFFMRCAPMMSVHATISVRKESGNGNTWHVPTFKARMAEPVSVEEQVAMAELAALYLPMLQRTDESDTHGEEDLTKYATTTASGPTIDVPPAPSAAAVADILADESAGF